MNVLSLFAGIGGLELGLERAGMRIVGQVEINPFCQKVLAQHWPTVPKHDDVRTTIEWWKSKHRPPVDLICGGYPCQPFSTAGKMLATNDDRHLWPEFANVIRALRPRYALLENVPTHVRLGLDTVLADLAELGFDAEWSVVSAAAVGAPHRRPRLFVLAYTNKPKPVGGSWLPIFTGSRWREGQVPYAHRCRSHPRGATDAESWAAEPTVGRMAHGISSRLDRNRLYALGNAVVPAVAEFIGELIMFGDAKK